jgi:hypothetical protein
MKKIVKELAEKAGFILWKDEDWKPKGATVDCSQKKNAKKIECKEAPKSDIKPAIKKPEKVDRKAPKSMQKKAAEENAKK